MILAMNTRLVRKMIFIALFPAVQVYAQFPSNRIRPAIMYHAGDTIRSPRMGVVAVVPEGWEGVLPRDTEIFLLMPVDNTIGEIYVALNNNIDMQGQKMLWKEGLDMGNGTKLMLDGETSMRTPDVITGMAKLSGTNTNRGKKVYVEAKCSPVGFCLVYMLSADVQSFDHAKVALQAIVDHTTFGKPSTESPYLNFDWKKFLSGKVLLMTGYEGKSKREDKVIFCADGTFQSHLTRSGIFKDQSKEYQGNKKGKWEVQSNGENATITFSFNKLPPLDIMIEVKEEEIFVKGRRYFVGEDQTCK